MADLEEGVVYIEVKYKDNNGIVREELMESLFDPENQDEVCMLYRPAGNGGGSTMRPTNPR